MDYVKRAFVGRSDVQKRSGIAPYVRKSYGNYMKGSSNDSKEEVTLSLLCKELSPIQDNGNGVQTICAEALKHKMSLNEYYINVAVKGSLEEFQRLYEADPTRLTIKDSRGCTAIHKAAEHGREKILNFVFEHNADLNVLDNHGCTPLHYAVKAEQLSCINFLLDHGAHSNILNDEKEAPIHYAVEENATKSLETLLLHNTVDPNLPGELGCRALHYCASRDRDECAKILLQHGAKPCMKCDNGFFPISIAGRHASARTLEVLIQHVEALGYKREDVLAFTDKENNMPLHSAVNSGDLKAVEVCLKAGAPVDAKQSDSSSPLHFACAQGSSDMVKMMQEMQPDRFKVALHSVDILKMTPLHRAVLFDHVEVVKYLVEQGANINEKEIHQRTPLLLASSKGGWRTVVFLLSNGADITLKDKQNRNFLHLAIKFGVSIDTFGCTIIKNLKNLLNESDDFGCTPLHYASKEGHLVAIDDLLKHGATINPKDNDKKSPLHFAVKYGRFNTCKRLLESSMGPNIINETDGDGLSTLHIAASNGHLKIITLLMQKGAYVTRDYMENSPLHLAASSGYTKSMKLLLTVYPNLLDVSNKEGNTALHLASRESHTSAVEMLMSIGAKFKRNKQKETFIDIAIRERQTDVALSIIRHERWEEVLNLCSTEYSTPMNGLVQFLPEACMAALDRCQTQSKHDSRSPEFNVTFNFTYLQCPLRYMKEKDREGKVRVPMLALNTMVQHGRVQCLAHPVSEAFLNMKWRAYGSWFHISHFVIYAIYLAALTILVCTCTYSYKDVIATNNNQTNTTSNSSKTGDAVQMCKVMPLHYVCAYIVLVMCSCNMIKEIVQIIMQRRKYFSELTNLLEWVLYITSTLYITPFLSGHMADWQWEAGAVAIFLAWFNCLLFLQRFDFFGIYVVMFLEILRTLIQVLCVFSFLLIAFGMAFFILLNKESSNAFATPAISILRTTMMMLELDYMASFNDPFTDDDTKSLFFGGTTIFLLVVFVLLMPILLMNLLIGLAVGDIESVQKNATLKRLAMQVELHTDLERKLPYKILNMVDKSEFTYYPNKCSGYMYKVMSKLSFLGDPSSNLNCESGNATQNYLFGEMYKQKMRLKEIELKVTKQYDLLRLIVQKMEIRTEDDNKDEGYPTDMLSPIASSNKWAPASHKLVRQSAVVNTWKLSMSDQ